MQKAGILFIWVLMIFSFRAEAEVDNRLFFTPEQRVTIDQQRQSYLKGALISQQKPKKIKVIKKVKPVPLLPKKISVSSIIVLPDGEKSVRINDNFKKMPMKTKVIEKESTPEQATLEVGRQTVQVPVGMTYLPYANKTIKTYQYGHTRTIILPKKQSTHSKQPLKEQKKSLAEQLNTLRTLSNKGAE